MKMTSVSESFAQMEAGYRGEIPEVDGDFTPYWEDGAASSARETALNREAAERLVQAQALWALLKPWDAFPAAAFQEAWRQILLYDEHTWGAHNSITQPEGDFAVQQWKTKQAFALEADQRSRGLLGDAVADIQDAGPVSRIAVFNTASWPRTDLVMLPADRARPGDRVRDSGGNSVPSQALSTGELAFLAADVPPLGSAVYTVESGAAEPAGNARALENRLENGRVSLAVDEKTGAISSLKMAGIPADLAADGAGLNSYYYVAGRNPETQATVSAAEIRVKEAGPLVAALEVVSDAPGCRGLVREIRLVDGLDEVALFDWLDKEKQYEKEAVHIAFPFNVPGGVTRIDTPFAAVRPDRDQVKGACKNYYTVQRFADVSGPDYGVILATVDAPLLEIGAITCDPIAVGWLEESRDPETTLYSYVMNNYWETNYKAAQEGGHVFRYTIMPHTGGWNPAAAQRFGIEESQPLIAVPLKAGAEPPEPPVRLAAGAEKVVLQCLKPADDGQALIMRLFNPGGADAAVQIGKPEAAVLRQSTLAEEAGGAVSGAVSVAAGDFVTLRLEAADRVAQR
jgi:alpha-mannosidase